MGNFIRKCRAATIAANERNKALENLEHQILEDTRRKQEALDTARRVERHNRLVAHSGHTFRS